jgi:glycosyltransferase involved in cell wall biosynthesis
MNLIKNPELTILMPCLNEAETVATCIGKARHWIGRNGVAAEVVVADNGSSDGSQSIAEGAGARVVLSTTKGYGAALAAGIAAARGRFVIMGDADDSYDFSELDSFLEKLRQGNKLVVGNRFAGGIKPDAMRPLHRFLGNPVLSFIGRLFFKSGIGDFHCGLRGFDRDAILGLDLHTTGMEFASEMIVKATLSKLSIVEVPTVLSPDGRSRSSHLRSWRDGWRHLRFLLMYCPRWLFLFPGLALIAIGLLAFVFILPGPVHFGWGTLDIHTLLAGAALIVVGYQAVVFAVLTKVFGITEGLLPEDPALSRAFRYVTLETGLVIGAIEIMVGLLTAFAAVWRWKTGGFGNLEASSTMRLFIPAVTLLIVGSQTVFASFYLSILGLRRK